MSSAVRALAWYVTGLVFELWLRFDFLQYLLNVLYIFQKTNRFWRLVRKWMSWTTVASALRPLPYSLVTLVGTGILCRCPTPVSGSWKEVSVNSKKKYYFKLILFVEPCLYMYVKVYSWKLCFSRAAVMWSCQITWLLEKRSLQLQNDLQFLLWCLETSVKIFHLFIVRQIQHIPLDTGSPVVQCSLADPYIVLLTQEGQILMFTLRTESVGLGVRLVVGKPSISQVGHIIHYS